MKVRYLLIGLLLIAGAGWGVRAVWRAHRQLVTLDVREAPLPEVLRQIERQTWTRIRAERALADTRVTLHADDQPLRDVLNGLAQQANARTSLVYAIYGTRRGLKALDSALSGDGKLEPAGWTRIAPSFPSAGQALPAATVLAFQGRLPKELVMEASLSRQLAGNENRALTAEAAAATAQKVHGRWTTYFTLSKFSLGRAFSAGPSGGFSASMIGGVGGEGNRLPPKPPSQADLERVFQGFMARYPLGRFANLTPAQRVQRARRDRGLPEQ